MDKITIAKQAADLHTNYFSQRVLFDFLERNDLEAHIAVIRAAYGAQRDAMLSAMEREMPPGMAWTRPAGGMFLWATLPEGCDALALFDKAVAANVAFVPGIPFYAADPDRRTLRLNFSCCDPATIGEGVRRLARALAGCGT